MKPRPLGGRSGGALYADGTGGWNICYRDA